MGGPGSGRRFHYGAKSATDEYRWIDIRRWRRRGILSPGLLTDWTWRRADGVVTASMLVQVATDLSRVTLTTWHRNPDGELELDEGWPVWLDWTPCNFGGERPWFLCPACRRRAAILYGFPDFICRTCRGLAYPSQREDGLDRMGRKANRIRQRLGWKDGVLNPPEFRKPPRMRWATYEQLVREHEHLLTLFINGWTERLGIAHNQERADVEKRHSQRGDGATVAD